MTSHLWQQMLQYKKNRKYPQALKLAKQVLSRHPNDAKIVCGTADLHKRCGNLKEAFALYQPLADSDPVASNGLAQLYLLDGNMEKAREQYQSRAETNVVASNGLAHVYYLNGQYDEAEKQYARHAEKDHFASNGLAQVYLAQKRYAEAESQYGRLAYPEDERSIDINQIYVARTGLATTLLAQRRFKEAENHYISIANKSAVASNGLAHTYLLQNKLNQAYRQYRRHADKDPIAASGLVHVCILQEKYREAETFINRHDNKENDPISYYLGAIVAMKNGDLQKSKERIFSMVENCPFNKAQQPMLKLMAEAGIVDEKLYAFILEQENLTPEVIQPKKIDTVLKEFGTNLKMMDRPSIQPRSSSVYDAAYLIPVDRQSSRSTGLAYRQ